MTGRFSRRRPARLPLLLAAAGVAASVVALGQGQFRVATDLIRLDVSVLDRNAQPVHGLTAADFTVIEDGKPQTVTAFTEIDVPGPERFPAEWMRTTSPDFRRNDDAGDYRLVMAIRAGQAVQFVKDSLASFSAVTVEYNCTA